MSATGIDLNASRLCGAAGPVGTLPRPLSFDGHPELPLPISLAERKPRIGLAALAIGRVSPHLVCRDYLHRLGETGRWVFGRHRLDADRAMTLALEPVREALPRNEPLIVALPAYLTTAQCKRFADLARKARLNLRETISSPLAALWAAQSARPWDGPALLVDVDEHSLTWTSLLVEGRSSGVRQGRAVQHWALTGHGESAWQQRLLDGIADQCIRQTRRDPRASSQAEQRIYQQLGPLVEATEAGKTVALAIEGEHWFQEVIVEPDQPARFTRPLLASALAPLTECMRDTRQAPAECVLVTAAAARLPGLVAAIQANTGLSTQVALLGADAIARAAWDLAICSTAGNGPPSHRADLLDLQALPAPRPTNDTRLPRSASASRLPKPPAARSVVPEAPAERPPAAQPISRLDADEDFSLLIDE
jgi:hypothetical protein